MEVPFLSFDKINQKIRSEILSSFEEFFDDAWYILGDRLKAFEKEYADFNQVMYAIGTSNGLDALHLALKCLDIGKGDEVIIPSHTFIASALAVSYTGATPVMVEPSIETYTIDPNRIEEAISPRTKAIMPVHLYGQACEMGAIMGIAEKHGLFVVEDNAQAQGATYKGKLTGSWGHINGTSFYPGKNLGAFGDAGAITTDNTVFAENVMALRNYGSHKKYENELIGFNMRLDECQAGFLSVKLQYLKEWNAQRQQIAGWYNERLRDVGSLILPYVSEGATHVYHLYVVRTPHRDKLQKYLASNGIGSLIHYPIPIHLQDAYKDLGFKRSDFPIAEEIADTCLSLPLFPGMSEVQVDRVCQILKNFNLEI